MSRLSIFLLVLLLLLATPVLAAPTDHSDSLLTGRTTARELLLALAPQLLASFPREALDLEVQFGGNADQVTARFSDGAEQTEEIHPDIYVNFTNRISVSGRSVYFGASNTVIIPPFMRMPFMQVSAVLLEDGATLDATTSWGSNVWRVTTNDRRTVDGGAYYQVMGLHYVDYPAGYVPDAMFYFTYSSVRWIDE